VHCAVQCSDQDHITQVANSADVPAIASGSGGGSAQLARNGARCWILVNVMSTTLQLYLSQFLA
jgi:hypothetical protein